MGPVSLDQLKSILGVKTIDIGDAVWVDETDTGRDVWGNNAVLAYVPTIGGNGSNISLAEPAFGFTNTIEGHPFAETPYYEVFPTGVGMNRVQRGKLGFQRRVPHRRGDEPASRSFASTWWSCSPQAWG